MIKEDEGRAGHAMVMSKGEFLVIGGEENTCKNWMQIRDNSKKL